MPIDSAENARRPAFKWSAEVWSAFVTPQGSDEVGGKTGMFPTAKAQRSEATTRRVNG